ncbi:MAG TPA: hypothetical protein PKO05_00250 [Thermoanaerobaculia bacterium]|nr:MAG: hypothetical protein BWX64_01582 [Acidobacteria bacterium ADurb.Bin051]HNU81845.1 hypothetical protein [Thermoanaerobaculia bacterium]HPA96945.1 hypothetical protein [Thermoanaerobaculia bacterium]HPW22252.1 hypothetical protein [Vicinamibacterales bacterium]HQN09855.1 hypothetical protein [Thermoanaerobaculia bacterium]
MARIRTIKPDIWTDEKFAGLPTGAKLLFIGLISTADDMGRFRANPALLKASLFPLDGTRTGDLVKWLGLLEQVGMAIFYRVKDEALGQLVNWAKHQRLDNAAKGSILPGPDGETGSPGEFAANRGEPRRNAAKRGDFSGGVEGSRRTAAGGEGRGEEGKRSGEETRGEKVRGEDATPGADPSPPHLIFPCRERDKTWNLDDEELAALDALYPDIDLLATATRALRWVEADPHRRKTSRGYRRFLHDWFRRDIDFGRAIPRATSPAPTPGRNGNGATDRFVGRPNYDGTEAWDGREYVPRAEFVKRFPDVEIPPSPLELEEREGKAS